MQFFDLPPIAEFTDRRGKPYPIYGCSALGGFEFDDRLKEIYEILGHSENPDWRSLYIGDQWFRHHVNRCLELFSIDLDAVTLGQVEILLFGAGDIKAIEPGILWQINKDYDHGDTDRPAETNIPLTPGSLIESLVASGMGTLEAIELASKMPMKFLNQFLEARGERLSQQSPCGKPKLTARQKGDLKETLSRMKNG